MVTGAFPSPPLRYVPSFSSRKESSIRPRPYSKVAFGAIFPLGFIFPVAQSHARKWLPRLCFSIFEIQHAPPRNGLRCCAGGVPRMFSSVLAKPKFGNVVRMGEAPLPPHRSLGHFSFFCSTIFIESCHISRPSRFPLVNVFCKKKASTST